MRARLIILAIALLPAFGCIFAPSGNVGAERTSFDRVISTSGTAAIRVAPDVVAWHLTLADRDPELRAALDANDARLRSVLEAIDGLEVAPEDVQTSQLSFHRAFKTDEKGASTNEFSHYAVHRSVVMRQRDILRFDEFLRALVARTDFEASYSLETSKSIELREEARLAALRVARDKAEAMAAELGVKVGRVLRIDEYSAGGSGFRIAPQSFNPGFYSDPFEDRSGGTFAPGAIEVRVTIPVTFAIED
jgi:hypothetical protein